MYNIVRCSIVVTMTKQEIYEQQKSYISVTIVFGEVTPRMFHGNG